MKNIYLSLFLLFTLQGIQAAHIIGGSIYYEHVGGDEYLIKLEVLRDCQGGGAFFDDPAFVGILDADGNVVNVLNVPYDPMSNDTISLDVDNLCFALPPNLCIQRAVYEQSVSLPPITGGYTIAYQRCCRANAISNLFEPGQIGLTFHTHIDPSIENSSPVFNNNIPLGTRINTPFYYDVSATDPDGDSLVYELVTPFEGGSQLNVQPNPPSAPPYSPVSFISPTYSVSNMLGGSTPLTIDAQTGEMYAIPPNLGLFQVGYAIKEYRNGAHIGTTYNEFVFVVVFDNYGYDYDVSGQVLIEDSTPLDLGTVQLLEQDEVTDSLYLYAEEPVTPSGEYAFFDIPSGIYYLRAIVDPSSPYFNNYLPTYYESETFWYDATAMHQCMISENDLDINLIHVDSLIGDFVMSGLVVLPGGNTPVSNLTLLLLDENDNPIQARTTNSIGYFEFESLPSGSYSLSADFINSSIDNSNPPMIELQSDTSTLVLLYDEYLEFGTLTSLLPIGNVLGLNTYPNPVKDNLVIQLDLVEPNTISLDVYNIEGKHIESILEQKQLAAGSYTEEIFIENIPNGVYYLKIRNLEGIAVKKIVKQ